MFLVTGGAGFIGSNIVAALARSGHEVVVCDWLGVDARWNNLAKHEIAGIVAPPRLLEWLDRPQTRISAVIHMGAISSTTETDVERLVDNNIRATLDLLAWCARSETRFIYASSAATYGDGSAGFDDVFTSEALSKLRPLNAYGWSKHVVDRRLARLVENGELMPPQYVGLKFFNVFGPNEYHKGDMQSVIAQHYAKVAAGKPLRLFRSYRHEYADGGQLRDFIFVRDCVEVVIWLLENPDVNGLFNVGTGRARSWRDLASAMFTTMEREPNIEYIDMPTQLIEKYQYFTESKIERLRLAGYTCPFTPLEAALDTYITCYLASPDRYN